MLKRELPKWMVPTLIPCQGVKEMKSLATIRLQHHALFIILYGQVLIRDKAKG